jgi:hypothetical protein
LDFQFGWMFGNLIGYLIWSDLIWSVWFSCFCCFGYMIDLSIPLAYHHICLAWAWARLDYLLGIPLNL